MKFMETLIYSNQTGIRVLRHVLFWTLDCISVLVVLSADFELNRDIILGRLLIVPLTASVTYFIIYYLLPSYSRDRKVWKLVIGLVFSFLFLAYGVRYFRFEVIYPMIHSNIVLPIDKWSFLKVFRDTFRWMPGVCAAIAIKTLKTRGELARRNRALLVERNESELAFLKAQMHPHFLFNTLNTLYADAIAQGGKGQELVLRLSNLLRFILEECSRRVVPIEKEIKVIEDYIQLEKLRHGDRLSVDYRVELNGSPVFISPLVLLPFVENSCKHTLSLHPGKVHIVIHVQAIQGKVKLFVENERSLQRNGYSNGTGVRNVQRQLDLLYGKKYSLDIDKSNKKYTVNLEFPSLKENE